MKGSSYIVLYFGLCNLFIYLFVVLHDKNKKELGV
jgi:hypothetical protein